MTELPAGLSLDPEHGLIRLSPLPTAEEVDQFYAEEFYSRAQGSFVNDSSLGNMEGESEYHRMCYEDYQFLIERHLLSDATTPSLLDIGCGYGHWMHFMRDKGFKVRGLEPVQEGVDWARQMGLEVECSPIEGFEPSGSSRYEVVTMLNVLEHLRDPVSTLGSVARDYCSDGGLLLLKVPNEFNSLQLLANETFQLGNWWIARPQHINYFNSKSLTSVLNRSGFDVIDMVGTFPMEIFLLLGQLYVGDPDTGKQCHNRRVGFEKLARKMGQVSLLRSFYSDLAKAGLGREIVALCQLR